MSQLWGCDVITFAMSQLSVCDITSYCTCVYLVVGLNKHDIMDVQHYISKTKGAQFRQGDSSEAWYIVLLKNKSLKEFPSELKKSLVDNSYSSKGNTIQSSLSIFHAWLECQWPNTKIGLI